MKYFQKISLVVVLSFLSISCLKDLDTEPKFQLSIQQILERDPNAIEGLVGRIYSMFSLSSGAGPGESDIQAEDSGSSPFVRGLINLQDFSADGMKNSWGDDGLDQLTTTSNWTSDNKFFRFLFDRSYFIIPQATNLILALKNEVDVPDEEKHISELRFLRALSYYYIMDCFGKGVLVTDDNYGVTTPLPEASRAEIFNYIESELLAIESTIPTTKVYGHADVHVVRMLLAKLYLNAEVYTGTPSYDKALKYCELVINEGGYELDADYVSLFSGDNHMSKEIIFPLIADSQFTQSYGNVTYIVAGSLSNDIIDEKTNPGGTGMNANDYHSSEAWVGHRATKAWYGLYNDNGVVDSKEDLAASADDRSKLFWTDGHEFDMTDYKTYRDGFPSLKFRNSNFHDPSSSTVTQFTSTDFPMYRLADVYLMYAECVVRGAGGDMATAIKYVNDVRTRSNAPTVTAIDEQFIIDERGRELNLEGHRRMDLIRFNKFTGSSYLWPWKGGSSFGTAISDDLKLYPLPNIALSTNPNFVQNPGF